MPASRKMAEAQFILDFMMVQSEGEADDNSSRPSITVSRPRPHSG